MNPILLVYEYYHADGGLTVITAVKQCLDRLAECQSQIASTAEQKCNVLSLLFTQIDTDCNVRMPRQ
jgi:hypothetical protein